MLKALNKQNYNDFYIEYYVKDDLGNTAVKSMSVVDFNRRGISEKKYRDGRKKVTIELKNIEEKLKVTVHKIFYPETSIVEKWIVLKNERDIPVTVKRIDTLCLRIPESYSNLGYFKSGWGKEFTFVEEKLEGARVIEEKQGRSSETNHPWVIISEGKGKMLCFSIMWSGNWIFRIEKEEISPSKFYKITCGINPLKFYKILNPSESVESVHIVVGYASSSDIDDVSNQLIYCGRRFWYPRNKISRKLPVEWNHWWPYEDKEIDEQTFKRNTDIAKKLGVEVCVLDAGWFGPSDRNSSWVDYRGDWDKVNTNRFPSGIRKLSDYVHKKKMKFGLWCEIEAVGPKAKLNITHPEFIATKDGKSIGYICLGNPCASDWAFRTLNRIITEYNIDWIKLDFNISPGEGCNRTDHGHGKGDGLFAHYTAYYNLLERIRKKHPGILLENCSSGGLRIDLGIMKHLHNTYLSDPDMPVHSLQVFWGATTMLPPERCLHWMWSDAKSFQGLDLKRPGLKEYKFDYYVRISMLGHFGISHKLFEFPEWAKNRLKYHINLYKSKIRDFIRESKIYHLTDQPSRDGKGDRWCAFEYVIDEKSVPKNIKERPNIADTSGVSEISGIIFIFRLPHSTRRKTIKLKGLYPSKKYKLVWEDRNFAETNRTGRELMEKGIKISFLKEEQSAIIFLYKGK